MIKETYKTDEVDELVKVFAPSFPKSGLHENVEIIFTADNEELVGTATLWYSCYGGWQLDEDYDIENVELANNVIIDLLLTLDNRTKITIL